MARELRRRRKELVATRLRCRTLRWAGIEDLLDRVAVDGGGHLPALAVACVEAARRAGVGLGIVAGRTGDAG